LSNKYIEGVIDVEELSTWRLFFKNAGIKDAPDNGVEEFAMNYAEEIMGIKFESVIRDEKRNYGYDLEAYTKDDRLMRIEVKGQRSDNDVELTAN
jgi:hypothetical protein